MYSLVIANKDKEYVDALFNKNLIRHKLKKIQSKLHRIGTYDVCNISLSCFYDKRYISDDGISSLAYFIFKDLRSQLNQVKSIKSNKVKRIDKIK